MTHAPGRLPHNLEGALWMLASAVTFVAMTTLVKYLGRDYSPQLQNVYRQGASLLGVLPFIIRSPSLLATRRFGVILFRALCSTVGVTLMFYSYQKLPMADANALSFTRPLWVTLLAALVLREVLGPHRIAAVAAGFIGVLVLLRPGLHGMTMGAPQMAALGSAFLLALSITGMKSLSRDLSPLALLSWSAILGVVLSVPLAVPGWRWPAPTDLALLMLMGVLALFNQMFFIRGMSVGDAAAMAPLDYVRLVLSVAFGFLLFRELPDVAVLAGAAVIVASTLYITLREVRLARQARAAARAAPDA